MQILKRIGTDWREIRFISKLYMEQKVKVRLDRGETRSVEIGRGVRQDAVCHRFCSTCAVSVLPRELWMGLETSKSGAKSFSWFVAETLYMLFLVLFFKFYCDYINPLTPIDPYRGRTAPLISKHCILYICSTNIGTEYFKHGIYSPN